MTRVVIIRDVGRAPVSYAFLFDAAFILAWSISCSIPSGAAQTSSGLHCIALHSFLGENLNIQSFVGDVQDKIQANNVNAFCLDEKLTCFWTIFLFEKSASLSTSNSQESKIFQCL